MIPIKIKRKKLFTKKYLYNRSGELFGVNKDGQTVFSKTYKITSAIPNRIYKFINGEKILVATDLRDNKIASTITTTDKHILSIFKNNAVEATESRGYYAQNNKLLKSKLFSTNKTTGQKTLTTFNSDGNIENYIQKDSKNNILTEIHSEFDENGKLMTLVTKQNQYDLISYEYFDTKTGKSLYTKSIDKDGKLRSIMERKYLKGTNHLASENGFILGYSPEYKTQIKMVYNPETHKLKEETTLTKFKDTSSTISSIRTIESEIEKYCQEIKTSNNKIYKHEYIYDNNNNKLLKNNFLSGDKKISELTYWKIFSKVLSAQM
jgi:RNA binding exosome subunit